MRKSIISLLLSSLYLLGASLNGQETQALPTPVQKGWLCDNRIYVEVGPLSRMQSANTANGGAQQLGEHFANRLGDIIPMRVKIYCLEPQSDKQEPVRIDFSALKAGRCTIDGDHDPDWVVVAQSVLSASEHPVNLPNKPSACTIKMPHGNLVKAQLWDIVVFVQTKRQPEPTLFWLEFAAATELTPNGSPDWKKVSTPDFIVSQSRTADDGKDMSMGNTQFVEQTPPLLLGTACLALGSILVLTPVCHLLIVAARRRFTWSKQMDPSERAWTVFEPLFANPGKDGLYNFDKDQVIQIVSTLKQFFGINYGVKQLQEHRFDFDDGEELLGILTALESGVLECGATLSSERYTELVARICRLCPKP